MVFYPVKICDLYWYYKILIDQPRRKYKQGDQNRRILRRGKAQSEVVIQAQRQQNETASLKKYQATWLTQARIKG